MTRLLIFKYWRHCFININKFIFANSEKNFEKMTTSTTAHLKRFIRTTDIINTCVTLSQTTGATVRKVLHSGSLNTVQKGICKIDVCTEADLRIQKTIQENLKELFPRSRIICEEEESSIDESIKAVITPD